MEGVDGICYTQNTEYSDFIMEDMQQSGKD